MEKKIIKFLIKNGFTLDEIVEIEPELKDGTETEETQKEETKEEKKDNIAVTLEEFKTQLKELRDSIHKTNRENTFKKPEEKKEATFEEDVEKLIEEVTR